MAKLLRLRRGTDVQHTTFTGAEGEVTVNTTNDSLHVHDGSTAGGTELAKADLSNVDGTLSNNLGFGDNVKATFGNGGDLEIYHESSTNNSIIKEKGTGNLKILAEDIVVRSALDNETFASFSLNGAANLYYDSALKFNTTSTGIDVTGTVTCDGLTCEGTALINSGSGILQLRDNDGAGTGDSVNYVEGQRSNGSINWRVGDVDSTSDLYLTAAADSNIIFSTNGTNRAVVNNEGIKPWANNTYDLGTSSAQWRNAYFDGTVNCDGLSCEGDATVTATSGRLYIQDNNTTGASTDCAIIGRDSANSSKWYYGTSDTGDWIYIWNYSNEAIQFGTNNTHRMSITSSGHLVPSGGNTYDLGDSTNRWRNVYTNDLNLSNEGGANDVDGTWGSWTIQEGEDELFLLNRRNGKKYKFALQEVN